MRRTCGMIATLLPMLFHSIFGCCWHHSHGVGHPSAQSVAVESRCGHAHASQLSCQHNGESTQADIDLANGSSPARDSDAPCDDGRPCEEDRCVFLPRETVKQTFAFACCSFDLAVELKQNAAVETFCNAMSIQTQSDQQTSSVNLRAMIQVWVV